MLTLGDSFPAFSAQAVVSIEPGKEFTTLDGASYPGKWKVYFFWPKDFTFVCPTEIAGFGKLDGDFRDRDAQLLGVSTDSEFVHLAWRKQHPDLRDLPFPMIADLDWVERHIARPYETIRTEQIARSHRYVTEVKREIGWLVERPESRSARSEPIVRPVRSTPKVGRNEPCPCGSGKKYKRCCGARATRRQPRGLRRDHPVSASGLGLVHRRVGAAQ